MTSNIDPTKPTSGTAFTADVRSNFQKAHDEIGALQASTLPLTGGTLSGPLNLSGSGTVLAVPSGKVNIANFPKSTGDPADLAAKGIQSGDLYSNGGSVCVAP
jgi:hypothetical protein